MPPEDGLPITRRKPSLAEAPLYTSGHGLIAGGAALTSSTMTKNVAAYLVDIITELERLAASAGHHRLARILRFALNEARRQRDDR